MSRSPFSYLRSGFGWCWRMLDAGRRTVLNLLFLLILIALIYALCSGVPKLSPKTTLVLDLKGQLVEQSSSSVRDTLLNNVRGGEAMLHEVASAIDRFKATGKPVVAWGSSYDQSQYLLASHASEVYLHPMGAVLLQGFGHYRNYYHDALDKLGVTVNLLRVGIYKSLGEPYIANGPSPAASEAESYLNNALWSSYTGQIEQQRKLPAGAIMKTINDLPAQVAAVDGDLAKLALNEKLVDGIKPRDAIRQMMMQRGAKDSEGKTFRQINFDDYLARVHTKLTGDAVGVIVAEGEISDGIAAPGAIGGTSTAALIRQAREDDKIKSIVLRVDSPGGSAFASEIIRHELELTRAAGKPVVVSMGNVAASGGYWISMASDEVIADPTTITGSIGVFAILPTADKVIDKLGIHTGGNPTTWLADAGNPLRPLDPRFAQVIQASINHIYAEFTGKAAQARKTTPEKINEVAQGRVWTGAQAKDRGLVDTLGSYGDALKSAAKRAKLGNDYRGVYIERESSKFDKLLDLFDGSVAQALGVHVRLGLATTGMPPAAAADIAHDLGWLAELNTEHKPFMAITHCLCESP